MKMGKGFYLKSAFRNIWNGKRQSIIFFLGIFISVTIVTSLSLWSATAEDITVKDFMKDIDYEIRVRSYLPQNLPQIKDWLDSQELIERTTFIHHNQAFFNTEDKTPFYRFFPLDDQEDPSNPVILSTLFIVPNGTIERLSHQFTFEGEFELQPNEMLISRNVANLYQERLNKTIIPGTQLNVSICKQSVDFGIYLFQYQPKLFYNITVRGIYEIVPGNTMLQTTFSDDFISNSIIFHNDTMLTSDIEQMEENGLTPSLFAKMDSEKITEEGIDTAFAKIENLVERLQIAESSSLPTILDAPILDLKQSFSRANTYTLVLLPAILLGILQAVFTTNIVVEKRKNEFTIMKERGGNKGQIIGTMIIEFLILALVGIILAISVSLIISSLLPGFATSGFSWNSFVYFFSNLKVQILPIILTILGILVIITIYSALKINQFLNIEISERERKFRGKVQQWILLSFLIVISLGAFVSLIVLGIIFYQDYAEVYTYSLENTQRASVLFILITLVLLILAVGFSLLIIFFLGKFKLFHRLLLGKNGFFVRNNFNKSRYKFSPIIIILMIAISTTFFSLTLMKVLNQNEEQSNFYTNGADLRFKTKNVDYTFANNLTDIEGINQVMPVMKTSGQYGAEQLSIYGINTTIYANIGRWIDSSFNNKFASEFYEDYTTEEWLNKLDLNRNGTIISEEMATKYSLEIGEFVTFSNIPIQGSYSSDEYIITGIIHSAPGLGLASSSNLALDQPNDFFVLVNERKMHQDYDINTTSLFFGSMSESITIETITEQLADNTNVLAINPELVSVSFGEQYVNRYVPSLEVFIYLEIISVNLIALIVIVSNVDFILSQRKRNNAVLFALGNTWNNLLKIISSELLIISIFAILASLLIGLPLVLLSMLLTKPFLLERILVPFSFVIPIIPLAIVGAGIILVPILSAMPILLRTRREKVADTFFVLS